VPTYSYRCTECDRAFDIVQAFIDDTLTVCPTCGGKLRKVFSPVGVSFNGSGFYRTDSRAGEKTGSGSTTGATNDGASGSTSTESSSTTSSPTTAKLSTGKEATKPAASSTGSSGSPGS
jgi:putative FmdB family regulatory protein